MKSNIFISCLILLFTLLTNNAKCQFINLDDLLSLRTSSLPELQINMLKNGFYLQHNNKDRSKKIDSIIFNKQDESSIITFVSKKNIRDNNISLKHSNDSNFLIFSEELKKSDYQLIHTEMISSNGMLTYYHCRNKGVVILSYISYKNRQNAQSSAFKRQEYNFTILSEKESQRILRKFRS